MADFYVVVKKILDVRPESLRQNAVVCDAATGRVMQIVGSGSTNVAWQVFSSAYTCAGPFASDDIIYFRDRNGKGSLNYYLQLNALTPEKRQNVMRSKADFDADLAGCLMKWADCPAALPAEEKPAGSS